MDQSYVIFSDAAADIPVEIARANDIRFVPMNYTLGGEERVCFEAEDEEILKRFYDGQRNGDLTHTSQISPQQYKDIFEPIMREGKSILYLSLSSGLSGTYNSSVIAANDLNEQYENAETVCVDTRSATGGMGMLLEKAIENRGKGMTVRENGAWLEANRFRVCHWFIVDDLMYLKRGGRLSAASAIVGSALNIKPILKIEDDGTLNNFAKVRGTGAALDRLIEYYKLTSEGESDNRVYVIHSDNPKGADYLEKAIKEINPESRIARVTLGPIIGAHTGPGLCAVVNFGDRYKIGRS